MRKKQKSKMISMFIAFFMVMYNLLNINFICTEAISVDSSLEEFQEYVLNNWIKPLRVSYPPITNGRAFGASRTGRKHAANDYICNNNTPIYAMTDGTVIDYYLFYENTYALEILNDDGSILRYGEIESSLPIGTHVNQGEIIGKAISNIYGTCMLHLELYRGTGSGRLTNRENTTYWYLNTTGYTRREDLLDPTFLQNLPLTREPVIPDDELDIPYPRPIGSPVLQKDSIGDEVRWLQVALNKVGYELSIDGQFGANTDAAVRSFQEEYGLGVDGKVGPATIAKLVEIILNGDTTPRLSASTNSVSLNRIQEETETVIFTYFGYSGNVVVDFEHDADAIVSCTWGDWNGNAVPLTLIGNADGTETITINLKDADSGSIIAATTITVTVTSDEDIREINLIGDVNLDGEITAEDVVLLHQYLLSQQTLTKEQYVIADINSDGIVNVFDLVFLKRDLMEG